MCKILFLLLAAIVATESFAAINSQYNFENGVPGFVKVDGNGEVVSSDAKFKDGTHSLKFSWQGQAALTFNNCTDIEASMKAKAAGVMVWIYNTVPMDAPLRFSFINWSGDEICHFDFNMDFKGWRTAWIKYIDMLSPYGHYGDIKESERATNVAKMTVTTPASVPEGTIYIDRVSFCTKKMHDQITPDQQIPQNNYNLKRNMWHWCRLWEWEQYERPESNPLTGEQADMLYEVEKRMDEFYASGNPSREYVQSTLLKRADDAFRKYGLKRLDDGSVIGAPLMCDDEFNNSKGEMRIRFIQEILYYYALDYLYTGNKSNIDKVLITFDHAIDQGFAYGSGWGTNHHYGYQIRDLYKAMWIFRKEIAERGKLEEYHKVLEYWSGLAEARQPFVYGRDEILDSWHTLLGAKIISAMMEPSVEKRYANMKALGVWVSGSLAYSPGTLGGIKVDGTSFHHGGLYPAYSIGAFAELGNYCKFTRSTDFIIDEPARRTFKHALLTMRNYCNLTDWGLGVCGRHPFNGFIPKADIEAYGSLAVLGDLTGSGMEVDPELGGAYLTLGGSDKSTVAAVKKAGISPAQAPDGFFVYNYGAMGIHRRDDWMVVLKGYNSDVWASEIYTADNRFGRYQSYGSVQVIGSGSPVSAKASGYSQEGWDWNRVPGATTIHLPFEILDSPLKGTLMERNTSRFPGVSSLEGRNGVLAFTFVESDRERFCPGATAHKSVFCFDNRIIFIGSGITNNSTYPTETTLYQLRLDDKSEEVDINLDYFGQFPMNYRHSQNSPVTLTDTKGNVYMIPDGYGLVVEKKHQISPSDTKKKTGEGDFVTAYIDHGVSPKNVSVEYMMLVRPSGKDVNKFSKKYPYTVIRKDDAAHVLNDHITGTTAYVCYDKYDADASKDGFAAIPKGKDAKPYLPVLEISEETIVMERSLGEGRSVMSICTPDLGITKKAYTTAQESQTIEKTVVLDGSYKLETEDSAVSVEYTSNMTVLKAECRHGQPVEFVLVVK